MKKIYFIGIKGVGMTALAEVYQAKGFQVSGSDGTEKFFTDQVLQKAEIQYYEGFNPTHIDDSIDKIVVSGAYYEKNKLPTNPEVIAALDQQIPLLTYSQALGELSRDFFSLGVAGSHGKTTTSAWLAYTLQELGADPYAVIGSLVPQFGGNARIGGQDSTVLVAECDEYQNHFLDFFPKGLIITNLDYDHPDFFPTKEDYIEAFRQVIQKVPKEGVIVLSGDDSGIREHLLSQEALWQGRRYITYGQEEGCTIRLMSDNMIMRGEDELGVLKSFLPGLHNRMNALAVFSLLEALNYPVIDILDGIQKFRGTKRRLEYKGTTKQGSLVFDDYAHHPTEIRATLQAIQEQYPDKVIHCAFQPHTFTRTKALLTDFAKAFGESHHTYIVDIYGSAREAQGGVTSQELVAEARKHALQNTIEYISDREYLKNIFCQLDSSAILITMGAGDIWKIGQEIVD